MPVAPRGRFNHMGQPDDVNWINPQDYDHWRDAIRSGQVPLERIPTLLQENPSFADFLAAAGDPNAAMRRAVAKR